MEEISQLNWLITDKRHFEELSLALGTVIVSFTKELNPIFEGGERNEPNRLKNLKKALLAHDGLLKSAKSVLDRSMFLEQIKVKKEFSELIRRNS